MTKILFVGGPKDGDREGGWDEYEEVKVPLQIEPLSWIGDRQYTPLSQAFPIGIYRKSHLDPAPNFFLYQDLSFHQGLSRLVEFYQPLNSRKEFQMELRITKIVPDRKRGKVYLALEGKKQAWVEPSYLEEHKPVVGGFYGVSPEGVWYLSPEDHQKKLDALHVEDEEPMRIE